MTRKDLIYAALFAGLRLMAVGVALLALLQITFALIDIGYRFDPSYLSDFLFAHFLRPLLLLLTSFLLYRLAPPLSRWLSRSADLS